MPVPKNNGNVRMGVDFRDFNKACLKDNFPLPHYDRPEKVPLKKKDFCVLFRVPLFLGKWCGVTTYFLYKKIRKTKYKYMTELFPVID